MAGDKPSRPKKRRRLPRHDPRPTMSAGPSLVEAAIAPRSIRGQPTTPLEEAATLVLSRFSEGATLPREHPGLAQLAGELARPQTPIYSIERQVRDLSHAGYLRGAITVLAAQLRRRASAEAALLLARELLDALDPELGIEVARSVLTIPEVEASRLALGGPYTATNMLLGDALLEAGEPTSAIRHFEAVLAVDIDNARALRGWSGAVRALERRGISVVARARGLALLDGLEELELSAGLDSDRYELGRPLGRGRHAVVYQAFDRRVGRDVAIKRLLAGSSARAGPQTNARLIESRFFAEARTLARVRSPYVVALLDAQPRKRFIALGLCRGGNLRLAMRRRLIDASDLPRVGGQLSAALRAVHTAGAVHRDIKPVNILVREAHRGSPIALADFGLALRGGSRGEGHNAGTLRYLAPELRRGAGAMRATPETDIFSAGVVLLELALSPRPLPDVFDQIAGDFDAAEHIPEGLPGDWSRRLGRMLAHDPAHRSSQ